MMSSASSVPHFVIVFVFFVSCLLLVHGASWSYSNKNQWATQHPSHCSGQSQSPIDLKRSLVQYKENYAANPFSFTNFDNTNGISWTLTNNGHTAQVTYSGTAVTMTGGNLPDTYQVAQFHFHWGSSSTQGSEHTVDGISYPMELHIVTFNTKYSDLSNAVTHADGLAVLGVFIEIGSHNADMEKIVTALSQVTTANTDTTTITTFPLQAVLPSTTNYYRYSGGLTTPNCNEVVTWTVFEKTIKISSTQLNAFRALQDSHSSSLQDNYRPVQALNSRQITASFPASAPRTIGVSFLMLATALAASCGILRY